jgi:hypothetical protein
MCELGIFQNGLQISTLICIAKCEFQRHEVASRLNISQLSTKPAVILTAPYIFARRLHYGTGNLFFRLRDLKNPIYFTPGT